MIGSDNILAVHDVLVLLSCTGCGYWHHVARAGGTLQMSSSCTVHLIAWNLIKQAGKVPSTGGEFSGVLAWNALCDPSCSRLSCGLHTEKT